jgi:hypothetical protein
MDGGAVPVDELLRLSESDNGLTRVCVILGPGPESVDDDRVPDDRPTDESPMLLPAA